MGRIVSRNGKRNESRVGGCSYVLWHAKSFTKSIQRCRLPAVAFGHSGLSGVLPLWARSAERSQRFEDE